MQTVNRINSLKTGAHGGKRTPYGNGRPIRATEAKGPDAGIAGKGAHECEDAHRGEL